MSVRSVPRYDVVVLDLTIFGSDMSSIADISSDPSSASSTLFSSVASLPPMTDTAVLR